ncbi:hypothetical protein ACFW6F_35205 [Streptomyces sp. NPDC058746]|uniref:hypothetical protein n=1 Tax=Streptomyces sp. NPDC058746 TaxID=3346622 RepID=UPI0036C4D122
MGERREVYGVVQAAGRLRVPVAAWRWAAGSGLVPAADAGPGQWSRAVVEAVDPEAVRAALRGPIGAGVAADRLTQALGVPLPPMRPRVTAAAIGHLVRASLLVYLGGEAEFPEVHPEQVAALARRRDLPALLDQHVPLGPDQAAVRLGVRGRDFDEVVGLGFVAPVGTVEIDFKRQGGVTSVPLYNARDIALLDVVRPWVDWRAVRETRPGRRSPLACLTPVTPDTDRVLLAEVAGMARVGRAAVAHWRRCHADFPTPTAGTETRPEFERADVVAWLLANDKITLPAGAGQASLLVRGTGGATGRFRLDAPWLGLANDVEGTDQLSGWVADDSDADALAAVAAGYAGATLTRLTAPGAGPLAVLGDVRLTDRFRSGSGALRIMLEWPARLRGTTTRTGRGGVVRHGVPQTRTGEDCVCERRDCGGLDPVLWCPEHGAEIAPVLEWHAGGGLRCAQLTRGRAASA